MKPIVLARRRRTARIARPDGDDIIDNLPAEPCPWCKRVGRDSSGYRPGVRHTCGFLDNTASRQRPGGR